MNNKGTVKHDVYFIHCLFLIPQHLTWGVELTMLSLPEHLLRSRWQVVILTGNGVRQVQKAEPHSWRPAQLCVTQPAFSLVNGISCSIGTELRVHINNLLAGLFLHTGNQVRAASLGSRLVWRKLAGGRGPDYCLRGSTLSWFSRPSHTEYLVVL